MSTLQLNILPNGVAIILIDLPKQPVNVFTPELVIDLEGAVEQVLQQENIVGAVITSAKPGFIAGADLKELVTLYGQGITATVAAQRFSRENKLFRRIETGGKPFVAALNGLALGGGLELALACHQRLLTYRRHYWAYLR
jgi:3-hydroxyacyl-CoA dehydrogenase/enoyl-CoA hydratase/3-hydroxybutyryl-CoA epimerase